jgi:hypothetical protein
MKLNFETTNAGDTPARKLVVYNSFQFQPYPLPAYYVPGIPIGGDSSQVLGPGQSVGNSRPLGRAINPTILALLKLGTHRYYTFIVVQYEDVFWPKLFRRKPIRTTRLCASVPGDQFLAGIAGEQITIQWEYDPNHNDAD